MGTLQQELTKLTTLDSLTFDDDPTPSTTQEITMPITQEAPRGPEKTKRQLYWEWLHDHPASTARELAEAFDADHLEVATIMTKFMARGIVTRVKHAGLYCYTTSVPEYPALTREQRVAKMIEGRERAVANRRQSLKARRASVQVAAERRAAQPVAPTVGQGFVDSTQAFINSLTVHQAKAVYDELKKIFGG